MSVRSSCTLTCVHACAHTPVPSRDLEKEEWWVKTSQNISSVQTPCLQVVPGGKLLHVVTRLFRKHLLVPWVQKYPYALRLHSNNLRFCVLHSFLPSVFNEYLLFSEHLAWLLQAHMEMVCAQGFCSQGEEYPRWVRALFSLRPGELGGVDRAWVENVEHRVLKLKVRMYTVEFRKTAGSPEIKHRGIFLVLQFRGNQKETQCWSLCCFPYDSFSINHNPVSHSGAVLLCLAVRRLQGKQLWGREGGVSLCLMWNQLWETGGCSVPAARCPVWTEWLPAGLWVRVCPILWAIFPTE